jgi:hypothetical protein
MNMSFVKQLCLCFFILTATSANAVTISSFGNRLEASGNWTTVLQTDLSRFNLHEIGAPNASTSLYQGVLNMYGEASINITKINLGADASALSAAGVFFEIDSPHRFELTGTLAGDGASITFLTTHTTPGDVYATGIIEPGIYSFGARASVEGFGLGYSEIASYSAALNLTAVPIPAVAWLFGSGLLGLIGISRRKKSA